MSENEKSLKFGWGNFWIVLGFFQGGLAFFLGFIAGKTTAVIPNRGVALIGGVLGLGSAFGLMQRKLFGLYLVYATLALALLSGVIDIASGTSESIAGGVIIIGISALWFRYFQKRKDWFK